MATVRGLDGVVTVGATAVAEVTAWEFTEEVAEIDDAAMGDSDATTLAGLKRTTGQLTCWLDHSDTGQDALVVGTVVSLILLPGGSTSGFQRFTGSMRVISIQRAGERDGVVGLVVGFSNGQGSGFTEDTVT